MNRRLWCIGLVTLLALLLSGGVVAAAQGSVSSSEVNVRPAPGAGVSAVLAQATYTPTTVITVTSGADLDNSPSYTCYSDPFGAPAPAPDGICTLRRAIVEASALDVGDRPILIKFNIPGSDDGYNSTLDVWKIELIEDLPYIEGGQVIVDGETQGEIGGRSGAPKIIVNGGSIKLGETQYDDDNMALGLAIQEGEISLIGDNNVVEGNWVGLTDDGSAVYYIDDDPTKANYANIGGGSDNNVIKDNVVASARGESIVVEGDYNTIVGNYVGTNADGTVNDVAENRRCHADAVYNNWFTGDGIRVSGDYNQVGGPTVAERNVIVGMLFASPDPYSTPPYAMELTGSYNVVQNNYLGKDAAGEEKWICGMGMYISGESNRFVDNVIVNSGAAAMGLYGSTYTIDAITLRGNVAKNVPTALEFGPSPPFPLTWKTFNPAQITGIVGTTVNGTAGDSSPCANCIVELFLDDGDNALEALESVITTTANASGDWSVDIGITLAPTQGLRTNTTSVVDNQIGDRSAGTTSKFSDLYPVGVTPPDPTPTPSPTPPPTFPTPTPPMTPTRPITYATVLTVTTTEDLDTSPSYTCVGDYTGPPGPAPDGICTLRRALVEASADEVPRPVLINFDIPTSDDGYNGTLSVWKIELLDALPYISGGKVVIDGESQPGGRIDGPKIIVKGGSILLGEIAGDDNNAVYGLAMQEGEIAAVIDWNIIENCWAGLSDDGENIYYVDDDPTRSNYAGIRASGSNNLIRNNATASARIVSLNIAGNENTVMGNYVGTRADGTVPDVAFHRKCKPDAFYYNWFTGDGIHVGGNDNWVADNVVAGMLFASPDPEVSPPDAVEVTGHGNTIQNNRIGKDTADSEVGVCGVGIYVNNRFNRFIDNEIVNTGLYAFGIFGTEISLDALTLAGNTIQDVPAAIEYGPLVPVSLTNYIPAHVTGITGTTVVGTSGTDSPCPYCTVELFLDDGDDDVEALQSLKVVTATADGSWSAELPAPLDATEGLRTASTTSDFGQIPNFEVGTTSDFSRLYPDGVTPPVPPPTPTLAGPETVPPVTYLPAPEPPPTYATVITVTTAEDPDANPSYTCYADLVGPPAPAPDGKCTLRRAIVEANSEYTPRPVLIRFDIPTSDDGYNGGLGTWKIELMDDLPYIQEGQVVISGTSQPGGRIDGPKIIVKGGNIRLGEIAGDDNNAVYGLAVQEGEIAAVTDRNIIEDCWAGLSDDGQSIHYINNNPDQASYASIRAGGSNNLIRDNVASSAQEVNFNIAGNYNIVVGNRSGTRADGTVGEVARNRKCHADAIYYNWFTGDGLHVGGNYNQVRDNVIAGMLFASLDPETTAPDAVEVTGHHNVIENNRIGVDANGEEVGVCGVGVYVSNGYNQFIDNQVADSGSYAFGIFGSGISLDATTLRGNTLKDVPAAIEFGPLVPVTRNYFNAAQITDIIGLNVSGTSGPDWSAGYDGPSGPSFCPFCQVELFLDDGDDLVEALEPVATAQADGDGNWSATLGATLAPTQGLRTASTTRNFGVIESFEISTTTRFSPLYGDPTPPDPEPEPTPVPPQAAPPVAYLPVPTPPPTYGATLVVDTAADPDTSLSYTCYGTYTGGYGPPGDGLCTLRRAIIEASKVATRPVLIEFNIPTSDDGYDGTLDAWTIDAAGALPNVKGSQVVISGTSQPGGRSDGPKIILHGSDLKLGQVAGEDEHIVRGLALQMGGIYLVGDRNIVQDNWIGLNDDGQTIYYDLDDPSRSNKATVYGTSDNNLIQDNVVATSIGIGIDLQGDDNVVVGNRVGTRADGTLPGDIPPGDLCVPDATYNWWTGAGLDITGNRNRIGGPTTAERNVIAGMLSPSTSSTPPAAVNIAGRDNVVENNYIGKDATGQDVWICGQAMDLSGLYNRVLNNAITTTVNTGWYAFGVWGGETSLDGLTMRGNTFANFDTAIEYGPTVPEALRLFNPALVTVISDTQVTGISDDDCPYCFVDVYLDDEDGTTEALTYLGHATATVSGDWSFVLTTPLTEGYGLRTVSTVRNFGVIENFEIGTSSKFSALFKERPPTAPSNVEITGAADLWTGEEYTFLASVSPAPTTTLPITYVWQATDQVPVTNRGGWDNDVSFTWDNAGTKAITVTASNAFGSKTDTMTVEVKELVALTGVGISGPTEGYAGQLYAFTTVVTPSNATTPITYTWAPEPEGGQGMATAEYRWDEPGVYTLSVTAENAGGGADDSFVFTIAAVPTQTVVVIGSSGGRLVYTDTRGLVTIIDIPPGVVGDGTVFTYTHVIEPVHAYGGLLFASRAFDLEATASLAGSVTVSLTYYDDDLAAAGIEESSLALYYWTGVEWDDVANTCTPASEYQRNEGTNTLSVAVCHLTSFGLFGGGEAGQFIYLPLVLRNS